MRLRIELEGMTYGELFQFVDLARSSGIDPDSEVMQARVDHHGEDFGVEALEAEMDLSGREIRPRTLGAQEVSELIGMMDRISTKEGDARGELDAVRRWWGMLLGGYSVGGLEPMP